MGVAIDATSGPAPSLQSRLSEAPSLFLEIGDQEFRLWQHNPITAAFFAYLEHRIASSRDVAADLVEVGGFVAGARPELQNIDVVRGQIVCLRALHGITLSDIQGFYGQEQPDSQDA